ncbi:serine/threonine-protein kinase pakE [Octopus bimaculoides]|uniref:C2H2-type domain-containing protein n=1 Tax=Octopus bimaculoides TaxID=37653 RepID=A0A0L8HQQ9_OCTBM|nr:serine/threonine-protein kinase pakE [Octopus bimaculoides]XP_014770631.1 serine/threonine-protein kinase pakE [Octopus bimaculoides]|eukprot:XP_014770630.1 PREDICTED: serine/threonine-protein kinase pakE-like [Octopus bimaculoides]
MGTKILDQILTMMLHGSPEEKHFIYNDSDIILECKLCRNLFRALTGFILHRKSLCMKPLEKSVSINSYDQNMRTETFRNVTFITNSSSCEEDSAQTPPQQPKTTSSSNNNNNNNNSNNNNNNNNNNDNNDNNDNQQQQQQQNLSAADHFQYLQNYVSQINESIESKSNLKAVLNLTQEGIGNSSDVTQKSAEESKTDSNSTERIVLTEASSPQVSTAVSSLKDSAPKSTDPPSHCCALGKPTNVQQTNCFTVASETAGELCNSRNSSPCSMPQLKLPCTKAGCVENNDNNKSSDESESLESSNTVCTAPHNEKFSKRSTKPLIVQSNTHASSSCVANKQGEAVEASEKSSSKSSHIEIILNDNPSMKDVIEINEVDNLEERVSQSLSLDNLCCVPLDQSGPVDQCCAANQKKQAPQHYICPHCPNTLIYDSYPLFCQHLESVHGIHADPIDNLGQPFELNNQSSMSYIPERANQKYSECIVLELADYQNLQCRKCKHSFTQRCSLRRHILEIHGEKLGYYSCPFCVSKVWFRYFRTFLAHLKNLHGFQKDQIYRIHRNLQKNSWVEFGSDQLPPDGNNTTSQLCNRVS